MGNRLPGGNVGASRQLDRQDAPAKPKRPTFWAFWFCRCVFRPHCFRLASLAENVTAQRSVTHLTITAQRSVTHLTITAQRSVTYLKITARRAVAYLTITNT
ncbi:MAG: hypothetical protein LBQ66_06255 [Planctomycetaceae bacterium]|nr:hypothetical protein [Planctomycetaceae bacterium]